MLLKKQRNNNNKYFKANCKCKIKKNGIKRLKMKHILKSCKHLNFKKKYKINNYVKLLIK